MSMEKTLVYILTFSWPQNLSIDIWLQRATLLSPRHHHRVAFYTNCCLLTSLWILDVYGIDIDVYFVFLMTSKLVSGKLWYQTLNFFSQGSKILSNYINCGFLSYLHSLDVYGRDICVHEPKFGRTFEGKVFHARVNKSHERCQVLFAHHLIQFSLWLLI
jgi:hypothetical protein